MLPQKYKTKNTVENNTNTQQEEHKCNLIFDVGCLQQ